MNLWLEFSDCFYRYLHLKKLSIFNKVMYFAFERDFIEANRCIPMIVRFKLDACGIKLKLAEWNRMKPVEREHLATATCSTPGEVSQYRENLRQLVLARTGNLPAEIAIEHSPAWSVTGDTPDCVKEKLSEGPWSLSAQQWGKLNDLQRFVLVKLSRPGHENKNFPRAMAEFGLMG